MGVGTKTLRWEGNHGFDKDQGFERGPGTLDKRTCGQTHNSVAATDTCSSKEHSQPPRLPPAPSLDPLKGIPGEALFRAGETNVVHRHGSQDLGIVASV